ncbi:MAG: MGH1-like glycoside hydrolase domain-containing protein [Pseudanabaena sp.]
MTEEELRLATYRDRQAHWRKWGSYLSDRQWGTVREDYSKDGEAWNYFPHDHARSRAYRWGEDGILGISDNHQQLCFAIALWNGEDSIIKERLFGLTGQEGNHGEDVKEYYFYLDNTPTHSYMKALYKYPHQAFPYTKLIQENRNRDRYQPEYELMDTGMFDGDRYFDVSVEYAKASPTDILIQIKVTNRGSKSQHLHLLPSLWFRNTWSWGDNSDKPQLKEVNTDGNMRIVDAQHSTLGNYWLYCNASEQNIPSILFTENETNYERLFKVKNASPYVKDGINNYLVRDRHDAINPEQVGTKAVAHYNLEIGAQETKVIHLRLTDSQQPQPFGDDFAQIFQRRQQEADEFYKCITPFEISEDERNVQRQAFAGMLWSKQFYYYIVEEWVDGDPKYPSPRPNIRNHEWKHLFSDEIISMPDKWEYPWFAAWDLAFHAIPLAVIDPAFAKLQLDRLTREWFMHPNGQLPAYEWSFSDVNPPVHAWATLRVYQIERKMYGYGDQQFLERVFQKLLLNFTWWVNRKDAEGKNVFQGGFLGLDNIGVFDRSKELPTGGFINQADGTSWMGMYCLNMLAIALELAKTNPTYEDIASKFFEHFLYIADAMNGIGNANVDLWNEEDGFYYDALNLPDGRHFSLKVRSVVGLIPLFAIATLEPDILEKLPNFKRRMDWFIHNRPNLKENVACMETKGMGARRLLAIAYKDKLRKILAKMLDENEFLSPYGIRSISRYHKDHPYILKVNGHEYSVDYQPAESNISLFGGNSNWRGPIWFPINYLIIESLQKFHYYLGDDFKVEFPTGSGQEMNLWQVASELSKRLTGIFLEEASGERPVYGNIKRFQNDPHWHDLILFHEYFHGDNGAGIGASHQTGWTGLVAKLILQCGEYQ